MDCKFENLNISWTQLSTIEFKQVNISVVKLTDLGLFCKPYYSINHLLTD